MAVILCLYGRTENILLLFVSGVVLCTVIEYITAILLEKLFHAKWWDYSNWKFNFQGRICLAGAAAFGTLSVVAIRFIHPAVISFTGRFSDTALMITAALILAVMLADLAWTVCGLIHLNVRMKEVQAAINSYLEQHLQTFDGMRKAVLDRFEESDFYSERIQKMVVFSRYQARRLTKAFPKMKPTRYRDAWGQNQGVHAEEKWRRLNGRHFGLPGLER